MNPDGTPDQVVYNKRRRKRTPKKVPIVTVRVSEELHRLITTAAKVQGLSINKLATLWFEDGIRAQTQMGSDNGSKIVIPPDMTFNEAYAASRYGQGFIERQMGSDNVDLSPPAPAAPVYDGSMPRTNY